MDIAVTAMRCILSPARNTRPCEHMPIEPEKPLFLAEAMRLVRVIREYAPWQLESLLDVNARRALEFYEHFQNFSEDSPGEAALFAYHGAAYRNMRPADFTAEDLIFAQSHLRILSALYGLLRPFDGILPHRLGLDRSYQFEGGDIYAFWGGKLHAELFRGCDTVLNIASNDYAKLITPYMKPGERMIHCRFLIMKQGRATATVSTVRAARGQMARYLIKNRVDRPEGIRFFDCDGYRYVDHASSENSYVFMRIPGL